VEEAIATELGDQDRLAGGNFGIHAESDENGLRLIGLASALNMVIGGTTFSLHLATWKSSDCTTFNQIDNVLIDARHKNNMMYVRNYRGANANSDHYLVTRIRAKISRSKYTPNKEKMIRYNTSKKEEGI
jgi:hypothetical protein